MSDHSTAVVDRFVSSRRAGTPALPSRRSAPRRTAGIRRVQFAAAALTTLAVGLQHPATAFRADASTYWAATMALLRGGDLHSAGMLDLRGIGTTVLYLPAGIAVSLAGGAGAAFAVLLQNAALVAFIGAFLLPRFIGLWRPVTPALVWVCAGGAALLLSGFAPYPLTDLWAAALLIVAILALEERRWYHLMISGTAAGLAFNLRPAVLFPVVAVALAVLVARRASALWFLAGSTIAVLPQTVYNLGQGISGLPWPAQTFALSGFQAHYASFTVRYDTLDTPAGLAPLFYCSPTMARAAEGAPPSSGGELARLFLTHPVQASVFSAQKIAAALHWSLAVPYTDRAPGVNALFALLVTAVAVVGAARACSALVRRGRHALSLAQASAVLVWLGSTGSLLTSATETRFALVLLLLGIAGCGGLAADGLRMPHGRSGRLGLVALSVGVLAVFAIGVTGLQHPVQGVATLEDCAGA